MLVLQLLLFATPSKSEAREKEKKKQVPRLGLPPKRPSSSSSRAWTQCCILTVCTS